MEHIPQSRRKRNRILPAGNGSARKPKQSERHRLSAAIATRFATTRRILESHSDLELENIDIVSSSDETETPDDAAFIPSLAQPRSIYAMEDEEEERRQSHNKELRQAHRAFPLGTGAPSLRGFFNSNFQGTCDIGMVAILREWRRMAQEMQRRRDELLGLWMHAFKHRKRMLLIDALGKWKVATRKVLADPNVQHRKVQRKLADKHYHMVLVGKAFDSIVHAFDLNRRLAEWTFRHNARTVADALDAWRRQIAERKHAALSRASALVRRARYRRIASNALGQWRNCLARRQHQHQYQHQHQQPRQKIRRARALTRDRHTVSRYQPDTNHHDHRVVQRSEEAMLDEFMDKRTAIQRNVLNSWRQLARQLTELDYSAEAFYNESLVLGSFDKFNGVAQNRADLQRSATRFDRYHTVTRALGVMRSVYRARRSEQVQAHALRDWSRKNEQRKRRTLLLAWHKVLVKDHGSNKALADKLLAERNRNLMLVCFNHWLALCPPQGKARLRSSIGTAAHETQTGYREEHSHRLVEYNDAQTMTSMIAADPPRRARAASLISKGIQTSDRGDDTTLMLKQRVRVAESEVDHYKAMAAESGEAAMALHARMHELGPRLAQFESWSRRRAVERFLGKARACIRTEQDKHKHTEAQSKATDKEMAQKVALQLAFSGWGKLARGIAKLGARADEWRCSLRSSHNKRICHSVLGVWRRSLKQRRHLYEAADARAAYWLKRRCMDNLFGLRFKIMDMNALAFSWLIKRTYVQVWCRFVECDLHISTIQRQNSANAQLLMDRDGILQIVDSETNDGYTQDTEPEQFSWDALNRAPAGAGAGAGEVCGIYFALTEEQENNLLDCFSQWHSLVSIMRETRDGVIEWLPDILKERAIASTATDSDGFEWELIHHRNLLDMCVRTLRGRTTVVLNKAKKQKTQHRRITEVKESTAGSIGAAEECDPKRLADLQQREKQFGASQAVRTRKRTMRRLKTVFIGSLLEKHLEGRIEQRAMSILAQQVKRMAKLRQLERSFVQKMVITGWRQRMFVLKTKNENASALADGSLVRSCFLHWRGMLRKNGKNSSNEKRAIFMRAIAFRWEKEARTALTRWMHACKNNLVRVALAQRCTDTSQRETKLMDIAADVCDKRISRSALDQLRRIARRRQLHKELRLRFAKAWCNTNVKRHALNVWRARISPNSSMFFSVADFSE
ncbi:hypothetical protein GGI23_000180 [Coemansia sp. RSA 2559]|nr:hypothetical protein GGI23_000180 [Coemansia sp. RSA 2559]KAJ2869530.1 hypothetical protein GGI22_000191 [Coemansia erecta]